jgi:hypothetical protein
MYGTVKRMENVISRGKAASLPDVVKGIEALAAEQQKTLTDLCFAAFNYERDHLTYVEPTAEQVDEYLRVLKDLRKRVETTAKTDPKLDLDWLVSRIDLSIGCFENDMSAEEADAFLAKHFPDER